MQLLHLKTKLLWQIATTPIFTGWNWLYESNNVSYHKLCLYISHNFSVTKQTRKDLTSAFKGPLKSSRSKKWKMSSRVIPCSLCWSTSIVSWGGLFTCKTFSTIFSVSDKVQPSSPWYSTRNRWSCSVDMQDPPPANSENASLRSWGGTCSVTLNFLKKNKKLLYLL